MAETQITSADDGAQVKNTSSTRPRPLASAVMTSFNKIEDVRKNLAAIFEQTRPFDEVIVVDNRSSDGTAAMIRQEFPSVKLIEMHHSGYGACETFNIGFGSAMSEFTAILDDDVVLPKDWLERMLAKFETEPETTAMISSKVIEPEMPDWHMNSPEVNAERYMSTFRGCATLARADVIKEAGYYDDRFFIYGNERDLACRVFNLGFRILQYPSVAVQHGTPFGMKQSPRSLYYHVRNLWLFLFKHASWFAIIGFVFGMLLKPFKKQKSPTADAVGTIGVFKTIRETKGGVWICVKATLNAFCNLPYCLKRRKVCKSPDFGLPVK